MNSVKTKQTSINIPTYKWEKEDIEPPLIREFTPRSQPIYPYTTQEIISDSKSLVKYKAVIIENNYLKLTFLPELNGRLYTAYDKINRRELLYNKGLIKPGLFGLRGAWAAVGIEYNFPNSHSVSTLEPINWEIKRYKDGSASFIAGNIEWVSRMAWTVEVKLGQGSSAIQIESKLYNMTEFHQRFYYWVNCGVPIDESTQIIFPRTTKKLYTHPPMDISLISLLDYPVHCNRDISLFKNIPQHFPIFAEKMEEDFFGLYYHKKKYGLVHVADHSLVKGRKIWLFGTSRDGRVWIDRLNENKEDYCELQSGPFTLQSDYRMLPPESFYLQNELLYSVEGTGAFKKASKELAVNIEIENKTITLLLNSTKIIKNLKICLKKGDSILKSKSISLTPLNLKKIEFLLPANIKENDIEFDFINENGNNILRYKNEEIDKKAVEEDKHANKLYPEETGDALYYKGKYAEEQGYPIKALNFYKKALEEDKNSINARVSIAGMYAYSGEFKKAVEILKEVLIIDKRNSEAIYIAAICSRKLLKYYEADACLKLLKEDILYTKYSLFQLAKISIMKKNYSEAVTRLTNLIKNYPGNSQFMSLYALCLRKTGEIEEASIALKNTKDAFGLDPLMWGEIVLINNKKTDQLVERNPQQIIEIICRYMDIEANNDAIDILYSYIKEMEKNKKSVLPLIFYYKGYLENVLGFCKESKKSFKTGCSLNTKWDFVFRLESEKVLKRALEVNPDDHKAQYHIGNLLAFKNRWEEAVSYWRKVKGEYHYLACRNQGLFFWKIENDPERAVIKYKKAVKEKNCSIKTLCEYDTLLEDMNLLSERINFFKRRKDVIKKDKRFLLRYASALIGGKYYKEALEVLLSTNFILAEGRYFTRMLYEEVCYGMGEECIKANNLPEALKYFKMPIEYPENLCAGKPSRNMEAEWWYRAGILLRKMGNIAESKDFFKRGGEKGDGVDINFFPLKNIVWEHEPDTIDIHYWINEFFRTLCLKEISENDKRSKVLDDIKAFIDSKIAEGRKNEPEVNLIKALVLYLNNNKRKAFEMLNDIKSNTIPYKRIKDFLNKG